jgi:hypothetical protein
MMERVLIKFSSASEETANLAKSSDEQAGVIKAHHCEVFKLVSMSVRFRS